MKLAVDDYNRAATVVTEAVKDLLALSSVTSEMLAERQHAADADRVKQLARGVVEAPMRVVVVGEYKSGKSTLVNAMIGADVAGADPVDSTTYPTEVSYGDERVAFVDVEVDGRWTVERLDLDAARLAALGQEGVVDGEVRGVRMAVPAPLLASGLTLLDTPSMSGGITSAVAASVLAELAQSAAWILTTDASQELTAPELELIKIGCSLCPIVIIVQTKCDLTPHWRRIAAINERHIARLDLEYSPVIVPVAASLRDVARRLGEERLDHESGLPLLTWYLTRVTTVTVRAHRARSASEVVASELAGLEVAIAGEIDLILNSGERAEILAAAAEARETVERLSQLARPTVERAVRAFQRDIHRDLQDRVEALRRATMDDLAEITDEREWPRIEQQTQAAVNRLFAEHLNYLSAAIDKVIDQVASELSVDAERVDVSRDVSLANRAEAHLTGQLDPPVRPKGGMSQLQPALVSARVGVTGAAGVGATYGLLGGVALVAGAALVPVAAAGAGWWVWRQHKVNEKMPWRRQAEVELNRFITDCHQLIGRRSEDMSDDVLGQLPSLLERRLRRLGESLTADVERYTALANDRANMHGDQIARLETRRDEARVLAAHARRLVHQLDAPMITLPLHVVEREVGESSTE